MLVQCGHILRNSQVSKGSPRTLSTTASTTSETTTQINGVKVVSLDVHTSPVSTLSLYIKAGSRYENYSTFGSTHFLKHLAFKGTRHKSAIRLVRDLEDIGASFHTEIGRESIGYHLQNFQEKKNDNVQLLSETLRYILEPNLHEYEIETVKKIIDRETSTLSNDPPTTLIETLHSEAFPDFGLGNRLFVNPSVISSVDPLSVAKHVKATFFGDNRIAIIGTGIDHQVLLKTLEPLFSNLPKFLPIEGLPNEDKTIFSGGKVIRLNGPSDQTHVAIGFPGAAITHKDYSTVLVLKEILENNSAKLHENPWILHSKFFNFSYSDAGLFGIYVNANPGHGEEVLKALHKEITNLHNLKEDVLEGAKNAVKVKILKSFSEDRFNFVNNIYEEVVHEVNGYSSVDKVNSAGFNNFVQSVSNSKPVVVAAGNVRGIK